MCEGEIRLIVGLGNPGRSYAGTRHNAGFRVIDALADSLGMDVGKRKFGGSLGEGEFGGKKLILLKPLKYMNNSGQVVATAAGFYRIDLCNLLVVSDELALEPGRIRIRAEGSAGGHNGLADIIARLGSSDFNRLRIGIGQSGSQWSEDYVLEKPSGEQKPLLEEAIEKARQAALCWMECGVEAAMNKFNN